MTLSIRKRLTLWYVTLLTVSLLAFGMSFFYALSKVFLDRTDREISSVAGMLSHTIIQPPGVLRPPRNFDIILDRFFGVRIAGKHIQVFDPEGKVVARSSNLEGITLPLSREAYEGARDGRATYEDVKIPGVYPIRTITRPIVLKNMGIVAVVQVGSSMEGMQVIFHYMLYFFGLGIVVSVVVASWVGGFLAKKALKPVEDITTMARRIGVENLNERLEIEVPHDEIGRLAETLNDMIARLERSFDQIKQFTADASHELKTPLTVLKGEVEVALRSGGSTEELRQTLVSNLEEIDRMSHIVKNLLLLARADVEVGGAPPMEAKLDNVLGESFEHFRRLALDKGVELEITKNDSSTVMGDSVRLSQLIYNLIDNAVKYTPSGGRVALSLTSEDGSALLTVSDTGVGIDGEDLPYIFDRFYRVDKARTGGAGSFGLGLSICREIVASYGGEIDVSSEPGKGTVFTVRLPLAKGR
ncbi:MAG: ATP-binding protein [Thermodesulfobacteriota bacterium]